MARADLVKKLFSSYKNNNDEMFIKTANEIIDDEIKKNHKILAEDLRAILRSEGVKKKNISTFSSQTPRDKDKDVPLVEVVYPEKYFSDIVTTESIREQLEKVILEFRNWDVLMSNGVFPIRKILFYGPPGCGKTLSAQALASEMGIPLLYVRFDAVVSSYLGETASNIRKVFEYAKNESWIIFFDEFDAIGRSRDDATEHGEIKRVVNTFLQQIDNYKGRSLIIAATNYEKSLDYAIWRRFDETINFQMPSYTEQKKLLELKLNQFKGPIHIFDENKSKMTNFNHSDIAKVAENIMKKCILRGNRVYSKKDIVEAITQQEQNVKLRKTEYKQ